MKKENNTGFRVKIYPDTSEFFEVDRDEVAEFLEEDVTEELTDFENLSWVGEA